jgi:hypothetical protein
LKENQKLLDNTFKFIQFLKNRYKTMELNGITLILILNSFLLIGLTLSQNESSKDAASTQTTSVVNPFEIVTWICLLLQLVCLVIKQKMSDF